jgi:hypothetical protein
VPAGSAYGVPRGTVAPRLWLPVSGQGREDTRPGRATRPWTRCQGSGAALPSPARLGSLRRLGGACTAGTAIAAGAASVPDGILGRKR